MHPKLLTIPAFDVLGRTLGPLPVPTYGMLLAIAFLVGLWITARQARREGLDAGRITDMAVWVLIAGLVGAKAMLVAVDWRYFSSRPAELWSLLQSGGVFYGGLLAGILVAWYYARRHGLPAWRTADVLAPGVVIGQAIGRLGCFSAGCCWGKTCSLPWGVTFTDAHAGATIGTPLGSPLHPSQLYESAAAFLVFALLLRLSRHKGFHGQVALAYVGGYSLIRFILEFWRGDAERGLWFGDTLSTSQMVAVVLLIAVAVLYPIARRRNQTTASPAAAAA
jgi:phosphatidylglycerol:prolipoprotein diacylglycerol transferase